MDAKNSEAHGGGLGPAVKRNPNKDKDLNGAPDGPYPHLMGFTDDGGYDGDLSAPGKNGMTFYFK